MADPLPYAEALLHVRSMLAPDKYRNYAVSDFARYRSIVEKNASAAELQKTWALYLKWVALSKANPGTYGSPNGKPFNPTKKFRYERGGGKDGAPKLCPDTQQLGGEVREAELHGVGQCEYFAGLAYAALTRGGKDGKIPRVDKVSTPGHNWVLVNYSEDQSTSPHWIAVDYWFKALGLPPKKYICSYDSFYWRGQELEFVETWNPENRG